MPTYNLIWRESADDDHGYDKTVTTGAGTLLVEAVSKAEVEAEIKKYAGCQTGYNEGIGILRIEEWPGLNKGKPLSAIGNLLDPWNMKELLGL